MGSGYAPEGEAPAKALELMRQALHLLDQDGGQEVAAVHLQHAIDTVNAGPAIHPPD